MKLSRSLVSIFLCLSLTGMLTFEAQAQFFMFQNPLIDEEAPNFSIPTLSGREQDLNTFRDGQKAIIFFWATWCPHCRKQLTELNDMKSELEDSEIKIVLIDLGESAKQVRSYMEKNKIDIEVFLDQEQLISEEYGIVGVPTFYFVNKDGIIKAVEHEIPSNYEEILNS